MNEPVPAPLLQHLFNISRHLAGHLDFLSATTAVSAEIAQFLPYDHLDVCMVHPDGHVTRAYESGVDTDWGIEGHCDPELSPIRLLLRREVDFILTPDAMTDLRFLFPGVFNQPIFDHELRARMHVPLLVEGELIGALSISSKNAGRYSMREVTHARYVADLLAPYFYALHAAEQARHWALTEAQARQAEELARKQAEQARKREEALRVGALELTRLLEHERQRIGMDLHDQTLADLTRMMRDLREEDGPITAPPLLSRLQDCIEELRRIIDSAAPTILELFGFAHAVRIHLERAVGADDVEVAVFDRAGALPDTLGATSLVALFRIAQEAINNAARHSGARKIEVRIGVRANENAPAPQLTVEIIDDGHGLPDQLAQGKRPLRHTGGLAHMQTRARLIAADFTMVSGSQGTHITLVLDCTPQPPPAAVLDPTPPLHSIGPL